jgi:hypothetical protein
VRVRSAQPHPDQDGDNAQKSRHGHRNKEPLYSVHGDLLEESAASAPVAQAEAVTVLRGPFGRHQGARTAILGSLMRNDPAFAYVNPGFLTPPLPATIKAHSMRRPLRTRWKRPSRRIIASSRLGASCCCGRTRRLLNSIAARHPSGKALEAPLPRTQGRFRW